MMLPHSREYFVHVMIEVVDDDPQPRPGQSTRPGFYQWSGSAGRMQASCSSRLPAEWAEAVCLALVRRTPETPTRSFESVQLLIRF
jgi:hypothetical protein